MEGGPLFLHYLRYRIKRGNKGLEYTIWRNEEFRQIVLGFAKRFTVYGLSLRVNKKQICFTCFLLII